MYLFSDVPSEVTWGRRLANVGGFVGGAALAGVGGIILGAGGLLSFTGIGTLPGVAAFGIGCGMVAAGAGIVIAATADYGTNLHGQKAKHEEYLKTHKSTYAQELQYQKDLNRFIKETTREVMASLEEKGLKYGGVIFNRGLAKKDEVKLMVSSLIAESIRDGIHGGKPIGDLDVRDRLNLKNPGLRKEAADALTGVVTGLFGTPPEITRGISVPRWSMHKQVVADGVYRGGHCRRAHDITAIMVEREGNTAPLLALEDSSLSTSFYSESEPVQHRHSSRSNSSRHRHHVEVGSEEEMQQPASRHSRHAETVGKGDWRGALAQNGIVLDEDGAATTRRGGGGSRR